MPSRRAAALTLAAAMSLAMLTSGAPKAAESLLETRSPWRTLDVPGETAATFAFLTGGEVVGRAEAAVGFLYRPVETTTTELVWTWRVDEAPPPAPQFTAERDDRPAAVHLWLAKPDVSPTLFGGFAEFLGYPRVTHVLTYVWGGPADGPITGANPYHGRGRVMVLQSAATPLGAWRMERRTIAADLRAAFGDDVALRHLQYVALSIDTDDLGGRASTRFRGLMFGAPDG